MNLPSPDSHLHHKILLVDAHAKERSRLETLLSEHGYRAFLQTDNYHEAMELIESQMPSLLIVAETIEEGDGFTLCSLIRQKTSFAMMPIIITLSSDTADKRVKAFSAGASDVITDSVPDEEFLMRVKNHLFHSSILDDLRQSYGRLEREMQDAKKMQEMLMPEENWLRQLQLRHRLDIASYSEMSAMVGGDFWHVKELSDHELALSMTDFAGHGVSAAFNTFRLHALMNETSSQQFDPAAYLVYLNQNLLKLLPREQFATMFYAVMNTASNQLTYATAATTSAIVIRTAEKKCEILSGEGFPLGVVEEAEYESHTISFHEGDALLLYSDALIETKSSDGCFITEEEIMTLCQNMAAPEVFHAEIFIEALKDYLGRHQAGDLEDDLTLTVYHRCALFGA